jgi:paraquat-inducible protein B
MNMTPTSDPDYAQLEQALNNHQRELTKIDDRIWIEEHNEMLTDLQQRIKGLPSVRCSLSPPHTLGNPALNCCAHLC